MNTYNKLGFARLTEVQNKIQNIKNKNILILSSCGSGKTEASYFNLLQDNNRIIFIEPMKTLSDSIHDRLNKYNNKLKLGEVTIQHSSRQEDRFLNNKYCVTTIDQILSGYLALGTQSFIKGKNVLQSNLIFDEVQLFGTEDMLLTTINMLDELNKLNQRFIIMTATMPSYLMELFKDRYDMEVIISNELRTDREVNLYWREELDYNEINEYKGKQIIICNTKRQLREIYSQLDKDRVIVLHSGFVNSDRLKIEKELYKYFGKNSGDNDKILLTTQIVEVGIDISSNRLYTTLCPIDNLIQRDGRCCRWGGDGEVIVFRNTDKIYDENVIQSTQEFIKNHNGINFTWDIQKKAVDLILNPYYKMKVNKKILKQNKNNFKFCSRNRLIRDVQTVNLIICNKENISIEDFNRETISIYMNELKNIANSNELYILSRNEIKTVSYFNIEIGDTILIKGNGCRYDKLGFRYKDSIFVEDNVIIFPLIQSKTNTDYTDYIYEEWIHHADTVKDLMSYRLNQEYFNEYIHINRKKIAFYSGLHDLGKLDIEWQKKTNIKNSTLAHFPFTKGSRGEVRTHSGIGAYILKDFIDDDIIFNLILQHHKRIPIDEGVINKTSSWELHKDTYNILNEYGFKELIKTKGVQTLINNKDIITPSHKDWTTLLYLVGTFMEVEIQAIKEYINNNKYIK